MIYTLPTSVDVNGHEYAVRSDFRAILDILEAVNDAELNDHERVAVLLKIFYPGFEDMPSDDYEKAIGKCMWFISGGYDYPGQYQRHKIGVGKPPNWYRR